MKITMFSRTKNETTTRPTPNGLPSDVVDALAAVLDETFPPGELPDDSDRALVESICPDIVRATRRLRRQRILDDAATLPIGDFIRDITTAMQGVETALAKHSEIERQMQRLKAEESKLGMAADTDANAAVQVAETRAKTASLSGWLQDAPALIKAVQTLSGALDVAGGSVAGLKRHLGQWTQQNTIWGQWGHRSTQFSQLDAKGQGHIILEIARNAISELRSVQSGGFFERYFAARYAPNQFGIRPMATHPAITFNLPDDDE